MFSIVNIYCRTETELGEIITELEQGGQKWSTGQTKGQATVSA